MEVSIEIRNAEELKLLHDMSEKLFALRDIEHKRWMEEFQTANNIVHVQEAEPAAKKAPKKAKPEQTAAPEPEVIKEPSNTKPEPIVIDAEVNYTTEHVREAVVDLSAALGSDAARTLLQEFGARKASEVPADKIGAFVAAAKAKVNDRQPHTLVD